MVKSRGEDAVCARAPPAGRSGLPHTRLSFLALRADAREHELATQRGVARRLAALLGCSFEDHAGAAVPAAGLGYVVPNDTLTSIDFALGLGIRDEDDLFGGVVPYPFMATKTITHPLLSRAAAAPAGWCPAFAEQVHDVVLPGNSAFTLTDARSAALSLLPGGPVRIKLAEGIGGLGQWVANDEAQVDAALAVLDAATLARHGLVVERQVVGVRTYSVGLLRVGAMRASYFGSQRNTRNRHGEEVYGGSPLTVVRGGFDALERVAAGDAGVMSAITMARTYHAAALACFTGMFASRCNYDVARGHDAHGRPLAGVLEQSWRIGGASGAEVAALEALHADPSLNVVRASTVEVHAEQAVVPAGATLYFSGIDEHVGPITKYAELHTDADPRTTG